MPKKTEVTKPINETLDARVTITASLPGFPLQESRLELRNFKGNTIGMKKQFPNLEAVIKNALIKEYGSIIK